MSHHETSHNRSARKDLKVWIYSLLMGCAGLFNAGFFATSLWAAEGVLPRGRSQGPGIQYSIKKQQDIDPSCYSYHWNPEDGYFYFGEKGEYLYWVAKDKAMPETKEASSYLLELQLADMKAKKLVGLKAGDDVELIGHGSPLEGVTLFDFSKSTHGCGQGYSVGVSVMWGKKNKVLQSFPEEYYKLVLTDRSTELVDRSQQVVRDFDLNSMQKIPPESLPKDGIPLFIDYHRDHVYSFLSQGHGILQRHELQDGKVIAQLKLAENMKLIQQDRRFGVGLPIDGEKQQIEVRRINGWTGQGFETMTLNLEAPLQSKHARVLMDFTSGLAAVLGESPAVRREWRHAMVVDGRSQKKLGQLRAPRGEYVAGVVLDPKARFFIFVTRSLADESLGTVSIFRLATKKWEQLHLSFP
ncbi:MAG: hypothetical protein ACOH5I_11265 [Oligoflexus sp.]